jgi:drug/metabolite transporter (DMT)-like permease
MAALFMLTVRFVFPPRFAVKSKKSHLWAAAIVYALTMQSFVIANKLTTSANAIMLQYSAPVWAGLLGWILIREKPHWEQWGALVCMVGGLALFFKDGLTGGAFLGDGLAILSGVFFGAHSVLLRMQKDGSPSDSMLLAHGLNFTLSIPFFFLYFPVFKAPAVAAVLYMGIIQIGCASLLLSYGIKRVSAVQAMLIAMVEPVLNPLWVLMVTGEKPSLSAILGGGIIITAVVASSVIGKKRSLGL